MTLSNVKSARPEGCDCDYPHPEGHQFTCALFHQDKKEILAPPTKALEMKVSMDGLRRNLANAYSNLVEFFNDTFRNEWYIDKEELEERLLELRQHIAWLHCVFSEKDDLFKDMTNDIDKNLIDITFNKKS